MNNRNLIAGLAIAGAGVAVAAWLTLTPENQDLAAPAPEISPASTALVNVRLPEELSPEAQLGKFGFEAKCAACHGTNAAGQDGVAPPLVHKIYEPSHHGDESFWRATQLGVRAHHWRFGNMPPVEGLTRSDVRAIVTYIRELQRANGIG